MRDQYRVDETNGVFELRGDAYFFIGKLNGRTLAEFLADQDAILDAELDGAA